MSRKSKSRAKKTAQGKLKDEDSSGSEEKTNGTQDPENEDSYEVEKIMGDRVFNGKTQYQIRWKGFSEESDSWENESMLECEDLIIAYVESKDAVAASTSKEADSPSEMPSKKKQKTKRSLSKRTGAPLREPGEDGEFEVESIKDVHLLRNGDRLFRIRWKGYTADDDTWEPEEHLRGTKVLERYLQKMDKAKEIAPKQLRVVRKHTEHYTLSTTEAGRRLSRRNAGKQRVTYHDAE